MDIPILGLPPPPKDKKPRECPVCFWTLTKVRRTRWGRVRLGYWCPRCNVIVQVHPAAKGWKPIEDPESTTPPKSPRVRKASAAVRKSRRP